MEAKQKEQNLITKDDLTLWKSNSVTEAYMEHLIDIITDAVDDIANGKVLQQNAAAIALSVTAKINYKQGLLYALLDAPYALLQEEDSPDEDEGDKEDGY